jgi:hypothetical protein
MQIDAPGRPRVLHDRFSREGVHGAPLNGETRHGRRLVTSLSGAGSDDGRSTTRVDVRQPHHIGGRSLWLTGRGGAVVAASSTDALDEAIRCLGATATVAWDHLQEKVTTPPLEMTDAITEALWLLTGTAATHPTGWLDILSST